MKPRVRKKTCHPVVDTEPENQLGCIRIKPGTKPAIPEPAVLRRHLTMNQEVKLGFPRGLKSRILGGPERLG